MAPFNQMGPTVAIKSDLPSIPASLADVALIDGPSCAAAAAISISAWHELVRTGNAPAPSIRRPRCTRWKLAAVKAWLIDRASQPCGEASIAVLANAIKASAAARTPSALAKARATRDANKAVVKTAARE